MVIYKVRTGLGKFKTIARDQAKGLSIIEITETVYTAGGERDTVIYLRGDGSEGTKD